MAHLSFTAHPASVGETYLEHLRHAGGVGLSMIRGGLVFLVNGLCPFLFARKGPSTAASFYGSMVTNREGVENRNDSVAGLSTQDHVPPRPIQGQQARSKAVAWWIEFANGRHSSPYPSEADARAFVAASHLVDTVPGETSPRWLVSSEGLRIPIPNARARASLRPIEVGLAALLAVFVGSAIYYGEYAPPTHAEASAPAEVSASLVGRTMATRRSHCFATVAWRSPKPRSGGRNSGLERLVTRILNAYDQDRKLYIGTNKRLASSVVVERMARPGRKRFQRL